MHYYLQLAGLDSGLEMRFFLFFFQTVYHALVIGEISYNYRDKVEFFKEVGF